MAELKKKLFGTLIGKLGDAVYRERKGTNYIAQLPKSFTAPTDEGFKNRTSKFAMSVKLASAIYSVKELKHFWTAKGTTFQQLNSLNYSCIDAGNFIRTVQLVPDNGFGVRYDSFSLTADTFELTLQPLTERAGIDPAVETQIQLAAIIYINNPVNETGKKFGFLKVVSEKQAFNLADPVTFTAALSTADSELFAEYQDKKTFVTLITYGQDDLPVQYARTFSPAA